MSSVLYQTIVKENSDGELYIEFNEDVMNAAGFKYGDRLKWTALPDGAYSLTKIDSEETELVLVEAVSMFRMRYLVEVPKGKAAHALDTVTMKAAKEFSQEHLDEIITSHRVISDVEALTLCREDNDYLASFDDEKLRELFFTDTDSGEKYDRNL